MLKWTGRDRGARTGLLLAAGIGLALSACAVITGPPGPGTISDRLAAFPSPGPALTGPVEVLWDAHQAPTIVAGNDDDLAFMLGMVHAHLRLGQMEIMRRIARGRLSELAGPFTRDIDQALRTVDFGRAAPAIVDAMPAGTRYWTERYVAGVNRYIDTTVDLPHEFDLFGIPREPWTPEDVVTLGRLASVDVNWITWFAFLAQRDRDDWPEVWAGLLDGASAGTPSIGPADRSDLSVVGQILGASGRTGSNSYAVAGARSQSGSALIANDPHLGFSIPNIWVIVALHSPDMQAVGLTVPGLPFIAVGRNRDIAWGGTNMRSANSDLVDVSAFPDDAFQNRRETIATRFWFDRTVDIRETAFGPVITDIPLLDTRAVAALRWVGHLPTDEMTAMLGVNRAADWADFRAALEGFAVSPQNMIYADRHGNIGHVLATHLPSRPDTPPPDVLTSPETDNGWARIVTSADLPFAFNPASGFVASANNRPAEADIPIGYFFSPDDRIDRLQDLLGGDGPIAFDDLAAAQRDVYMASAHSLAQTIHRLSQGAPLSLSASARSLLDDIAAWDGHYDAGSRGPVAFEALYASLVDHLYDDGDFGLLEATGRPMDFVARDLEAMTEDRLRDVFQATGEPAAEAAAAFATWGDMHRMTLRHPLGNLPLIGGRYTFDDYGVSGGRSTLMKTHHATTTQQHSALYGSQSRHISDMADPDANFFVLLGGQDGWINSTTSLDQVALWREGRFIQVPLTVEKARSNTVRTMVFGPQS